jgi:hypothetical protein
MPFWDDNTEISGVNVNPFSRPVWGIPGLGHALRFFDLPGYLLGGTALLNRIDHPVHGGELTPLERWGSVIPNAVEDTFASFVPRLPSEWSFPGVGKWLLASSVPGGYQAMHSREEVPILQGRPDYKQTGAGSDALRIARQKDVLASWREREDLSEWEKMGMEGSLGMVADPFMLIGKGASLVPRVGKVVGDAPLASLVRGMEKVAPKVPVVGWLAQPSKRGLYNEARENLGTVINEIAHGKGLSPHAFETGTQLVADQQNAAPNALAALRELNKKHLGLDEYSYRDLEQAVNNGVLDQKDVTRLVEQYDKAVQSLTDPVAIEKERRAFFDEIMDRADRGLKDLHQVKEPNALARMVQKISAPYKEGALSSGFLGVTNAMDIAVKNALEGVAPLQIFRDMRDALGGWKNLKNLTRKDFADTLNDLPEYRSFLGEKTAHLGMGDIGERVPGMVQSLFGYPEPMISRMGWGKALTAGGGLGLLSGNPVLGVPLGVVQAAMTKIGLPLSLNELRLGETVGRQRLFMNRGVRDYFRNAEGLNARAAQFIREQPNKLTEYFTPEIREQSLDRLWFAIEDIAKQRHNLTTAQGLNQPGSLLRMRQAVRDRDEVIRSLTDILDRTNYEHGPDSVMGFVEDLFRQKGYQPDATHLSEVRAAWNDLHGEAMRAGQKSVNKTHFNYSKDSNLTNLLRYVTPFPVWPVHNIPYYTAKAAEHPMQAAALARYFAGINERNAEQGLPGRMWGKVPVLPFLSGQLWANPLAPLSVFSQVQEPRIDNERNLLDAALSVPQTVGLGLMPWQEAGLQVLGLAGRDKDLPDLLPASRVLAPLAKVAESYGIPGNYEPERAWKLAPQAIRERLDPESANTEPYINYLVKQRIAEKALEETGKPWNASPKYRLAMADRNSPIFREAQREVGTEQAALYPIRRMVPLPTAYMSDTEQRIREARAQIPDEVIEQSYDTAYRMDPTAFAYSQIWGADAPVKALLDQYFLLSPYQKRVFLQLHPEIQQYLRN